MKLSPSLFCDMIKNLSVSQREWISQTGFGSILNFDLQSYPKYLSYSVVNNFDYDSCWIVIGGRSIEVSDVDVHDILGLPLGPQKIPFVKSEPLAKEWRKQYGECKNSFRVAVKDVISAVNDSMLADVNFKQNFVSLLICFFCQAPSNSYIRQNLLGCCCDLDRCFNYNWCEFVLRCLKKSTKFWLQNQETRYYTGSLPLLLLITKLYECCNLKTILLLKDCPINYTLMIYFKERGNWCSLKRDDGDLDWDLKLKVLKRKFHQ
ncbi:hypothetical protein DCAR_0311692 [Daucus carota subsp. sativus]|uniref:Uncharacterized protein n=1 Tax=Daucus carota subsp. sativus TaxID=79200 RepID=A0AAF0WPN8_DAUCS|nr:hypothetical protein DCAR_0311692 [Daucus carota subsp. sativus]